MKISLIVALFLVNYVQCKPAQIYPAGLVNGFDGVSETDNTNTDYESSLSSELIKIEDEIDLQINNTEPIPPVVREKRTFRTINRVFCMFFRAINPSCGSTTEAPPPAFENDEYWLQYISGNTTTTTTTTARPQLFGRKREWLRRWFPRLFGGRTTENSGFLANLLSSPRRIFRRLGLSRLFGGNGYGGSANEDF